ncbi:hypothetical protein D5W64_12145 [Salmonella enterica subsp. enterica serovar Saintpaul]|nr:hypothetical protein [Salmonella enterica subsp. enterica serovar Saintpaul]
MFTINKCGATRLVILTKRYAIKLPSFYSFEHFLLGLLANITEHKWRVIAENPDSHLCPSILGTRTGLFIVMRRCEPVNHRGLYFVELERLRVLSPSVTKIAPEFYLSDAKPENFGYYKGRFVKLDYGS